MMNGCLYNLTTLLQDRRCGIKAAIQHQLLLEPENPWAFSNLANCFLQKGFISQAKTYLLKTLEMDPEGEAGKCALFILSGLQAAEVSFPFELALDLPFS